MNPFPLVLVLVYLVLHSLLVFPARLTRTRRIRVLAVNLGLAALTAWALRGLPSDPDGVSGLVRSLYLWSPVVFFWWAYMWSAHILTAFHPPGRCLDRHLIRFEDRFGQPSLNWAATPRAWLTELLHFAYFSYYLYVPALGAWLQIRGDVPGFQAMSAAAGGGYLVSYLLFAVVPVAGPRWSLVEAGRLRAEDRQPPGYLFTRATYRILYGGLAHRGGAMPSSHTSTAVVFALWAWRLGGWEAGIPALCLACGMAAGAVYGRYHFLVDVVAGAALGLAAVAFSDWMLGISPLG